MARLGDHPNIVTVFDAVQDAGGLHIVARFMAGGSLAERLVALPDGRLAARRGAAHRPRAGRRARPCPRARGRPPRRQARQRLARRRRQRGPRRLRHRDGRRRRARDRRPRDRHALLPGARAGRGHRVAARSPTSTRSAPRCGSCSAGARRSPAPTRWRCSPSTATPSPIRRRAMRRASRRSSTRSCSRCWPSGRRTGPPAPPPCATRSTGSAARPRVPAVALAADRDPLVGRDAELAAPARRARRGPGRGSARVVAIAGEPGIGKTRLVDEAVAETGASGAAVVRGRAAEESRAYGPVARRAAAARRRRERAPGPGARRPAPAHRRRPSARGDRGRRGARRRGGAAAHVRRGRRARPRGGARAGALPRARRRPRRRPLVARAARPRAGRGAEGAAARRAHLPRAEVGAGHPLAAVLDALERDRRLTRVELHGLPEASVAALPAPAHRDRAGAPSARCTSGRRATRSSSASWCGCSPSGASWPATEPSCRRSSPTACARSSAARLEPLDPATREVLAIAGVAGRPFTIAGVARVGGLRPRERRRRARAGARRPARRAARRRAGPLRLRPRDRPRRGLRRAHARRCAPGCTPPSPSLLQESLEAGGEATAAEAAHHALAAARCGADPQPAWALSLEAAREAAALQAHAEAAAHYGGALEALELGAEVSPRRAARRDAGARRGAASRPATSRPRGAASPPSRRAARRSGAAELQARAALGFSQVQQYGVIDDGGDRAAPGRARRAPARTTARCARARPRGSGSGSTR